MDDRLVPEREDLFAYYAGQQEGQRLLRSAHNRLELLRTRELLQRQLPSPPAVVLDVGGGTGIQRPGWQAGATECISSTSSRSMSEPQLSTGW
jgi:ubiquinone/menaquinone biosynthesis C-methylase UbiE